MKRNWIYILSLLMVGVIATIAYQSYHYYAPPYLRQAYSSTTGNDDTLRIAYIGDSWAYMHKDHHCIISKILEDSLLQPVKVHSYGICGTTSKEIYENLFNNKGMKYFMQNRNYKYCIISAGINDTYKKMSTSYYQNSIDALVQFLLSNKICPIILEIPDYDIYKVYERQKPSRKLLRQISMFINKTPIDCQQMFRNALDEIIQEKKYTNMVIIIRYKSWAPNGIKDLNSFFRGDGMHLNEYGYYALDSVIAKEIIRDNTLCNDGQRAISPL